MKKFRKMLYITGLSGILAFFAACTGTALAMDYDGYDNPINGPNSTYENEATTASAGFIRFLAEAPSFEMLDGSEDFTIDIALPAIENPILATSVEKLIGDHKDAFLAANTTGYIYVRYDTFWFKERIFGLLLDIRSYGDNSGFAATRHTLNFDILTENFIGLEDVFASGADFRHPCSLLMFNFDDENLYLYITQATASPVSYRTTTIPLANFGDEWQGDILIEIVEETEPPTGHIALTFDDGPHGVHTPALLDGLKERGIPATFFLLGSYAERHPALVQRMYDEGHLIGNHSYSHPVLTWINRQNAIEELEKTSDIIESITGSRPRVLRPPYGEKDDAILELARQMDMSVILWSVDPRDWAYRNATTVRNNILNHTSDGSIILLHDIWESSVEAALSIVDTFVERGYAFVTVEELFAINAMDLEAGQVYRSIYHTARREDM
ncbi:MAG: polysaccharide deacetylase family protein [Defluviitaleaceae bacterium]|nr:polysaccharide deacetylase family protein [Defluviitaleaceae bacterium]